ncbi:hypothetical protein MP477_07240 [Chryseobacterium sp. WG23]|uniref:hypothetical protein n=1 Tax=Chryseobacterium sp. WG23 TaxID=2926910 RepID=UPI00211F3E69|nr:hypothetical protein [Chryseobacterium sp. WG23]MCQ9634749.1 hypothetical protein [Chryseobacterium sp. WG23]
MEHIEYFDKLIAFLENGIKEYRDIKVLINKGDISKEFEEVFNQIQKINELSMLFIIANSDLSISLKNLHIVKNDSEKLFFLKNIFLTIHEVIVVYSANGKLINSICKDDDQAMEACKTTAANLKKFKKDFNYDNYIIPLRNNISAHINIDSFYDETIQIDIEKTIEMILQFGNDFLSPATSLVRILLNSLIYNSLNKSST